MENDFFTQPNPREDDLREAMRSQWELDVETVKRRRIVPDWIGEPKPLPKDRAALLGLILSNGSVTWTKTPSRNNRELARAMGYKDRPKDGTADYSLFGIDNDVNICANAKATIDACERVGLIEGEVLKNGIAYSMTTQGEYALEDWQIERELGFL